MSATDPGSPPPSPRGARVVAAFAAAALMGAVAFFLATNFLTPAPTASSPQGAGREPALALATCTGRLAETPDLEFTIPLDRCDKAIDAIDVKSGFLSQWSICGGAKSFDISLNPRAVKVTSDAMHCSSTPSQVTVTFIGPRAR